MFRIATLNVHQGFHRWNERCHLVVEQLSDLSPDILCLNEISIPKDSGRWLWHEAKKLGLNYSYIQQTKTNMLSEDEGQAILSRFRVLESGHFNYQARGRIAQVVRLEIDGSVVDVYLTHLHHIAQEDGLRQYQVQRLLKWIDGRDQPDSVLICGDFNAIPGMQSIQLMQEKFQATQLLPTFPTALRQKDWGSENTEEHGASSPQFRPLIACLDYIWYQPTLRLVAGGLCFDKPSSRDNSLWPSDHIGIWADVEFQSEG